MTEARWIEDGYRTVVNDTLMIELVNIGTNQGETDPANRMVAVELTDPGTVRITKATHVETWRRGADRTSPDLYLLTARDERGPAFAHLYTCAADALEDLAAALENTGHQAAPRIAALAEEYTIHTRAANTDGDRPPEHDGLELPDRGYTWHLHRITSGERAREAAAALASYRTRTP